MARNAVVSTDQATTSNTWQIGGSRFPLYDAPLMYGGYGYGGVGTPTSFATPSVPPIYPQAGQYTPMSNTAAQAPFSLTKSPLLFVIVGLIGAVAALHWLHWHEEEEKKEAA